MILFLNCPFRWRWVENDSYGNLSLYKQLGWYGRCHSALVIRVCQSHHEQRYGNLIWVWSRDRVWCSRDDRLQCNTKPFHNRSIWTSTSWSSRSLRAHVPSPYHHVVAFVHRIWVSCADLAPQLVCCRVRRSIKRRAPVWIIADSDGRMTADHCDVRFQEWWGVPNIDRSVGRPSPTEDVVRCSYARVERWSKTVGDMRVSKQLK